MQDEKTKYEKEMLAMRYWLIGSKYFNALEAMEFARKFHNGMRKDGVTPEFAHQIFMANYVKAFLPSLSYGEETLATIFVHDTPEDYDIGFEEILARFGEVVSNSTKLMTKKYRGVNIPYETYFRELAKDPIASVVKGIDRAHNIFTMSGAKWTNEKQRNYLEEVSEYFLPMLKEARRNFPQQEAIYENLKTLLKIQMKHIEINLENQNHDVLMQSEERGNAKNLMR